MFSTIVPDTLYSPGYTQQLVYPSLFRKFHNEGSSVFAAQKREITPLPVQSLQFYTAPKSTVYNPQPSIAPNKVVETFQREKGINRSFFY